MLHTRRTRMRQINNFLGMFAVSLFSVVAFMLMLIMA